MIVRLQDTLNDMINPWSTNEPNGVDSLSSGIVATKEVQADLNRAYTMRVAQAEGFMARRLQEKAGIFSCSSQGKLAKNFCGAQKRQV